MSAGLIYDIISDDQLLDKLLFLNDMSYFL